MREKVKRFYPREGPQKQSGKREPGLGNSRFSAKQLQNQPIAERNAENRAYHFGMTTTTSRQGKKKGPSMDQTVSVVLPSLLILRSQLLCFLRADFGDNSCCPGRSRGT
jgi:hypothetical protein